MDARIQAQLNNAMHKINFDDKQKVEYVIPLWLRDEQIKINLATIKERIQPVAELRQEPVAVVGYGPSLSKTWEKIKEFKWVISCSGAHPFLIERGIVPHWHVAVDPLPGNTVRLIGEPHPSVEYLIASTCHPDVLEHLKGFNVKLWHIFDSAEDGLRTLPHGEWALFGGADAGLRSIVMARFLGFTDLHVFGIDGSFGDTGRHAGTHPSPQKPHYELEYNGRTFHTTPAMLACVKQLPHEIDQLTDVQTTFYGDGLAQAIMANYQRKPSKRSIQVGMCKEPLISNEYKCLNSQLHKSNLAYGVGGAKHAPTIIKLVAGLTKTGEPPPRVLDYGCGKSALANALPFAIDEYDPAIPGKEVSPKPADLVVCTDVLEHIEPERLHYVLTDLQRCVKQVGYFVIHTGPSTKTLADGRNSHLIQQGRQWWKAQLRQFFHLPPEAVNERPPLLYCVVSPLRKDQPKVPVAEPESLINEVELINA